jgi:two-component system, OmpR family, sensor histidine kinase KdpD
VVDSAPPVWISRPAIRRVLGIACASAIFAVLTPILVDNRDSISVATGLSLYLLGVVVVTAVGGRVPGYLSALIAPLLANWFLIPPYHTLRINEPENVVELAVFVSAATIVSVFVNRAERRSVEARSAEREAKILARLTESTALDPTEGILSLLRESLGLVTAEIVDHHDDASSTSEHPDGRSVRFHAVGDHQWLRIESQRLSSADERIVNSFVRQLARSIEQRRLRDLAMDAESLSKADELRTALLRSVSHDLRTPLANIKASVSSIRQPDVTWTTSEYDEFLASIEDETDRLASIIDDVLDLSRIESGVMQPRVSRVSLLEIVQDAVHHVDRHRRVEIDPDGTNIDVATDPALLERVLANLLDNAIKWSNHDRPVTVKVSGSPELRIAVIDHGPGIPATDRSLVIRPFHRSGDDRVAAGTGLGLAIVDRLVNLLDGRLSLEDTPGGGLTAVVVLDPKVRVS